MAQQKDCPLCQEAGGDLLWHNDLLRVITVDDDNHPGFTRVIWQAHIAEMTQLTMHARQTLMETVWLVEATQRQILQPDKINLAQFGNMVPHLHWHIIPRWANDSHFPEAIWAPAPARTSSQAADWDQNKSRLQKLLPAYRAALLNALQHSNIGITPIQ